MPNIIYVNDKPNYIYSLNDFFDLVRKHLGDSGYEYIIDVIDDFETEIYTMKEEMRELERKLGI